MRQRKLGSLNHCMEENCQPRSNNSFGVSSEVKPLKSGANLLQQLRLPLKMHTFHVFAYPGTGYSAHFPLKPLRHSQMTFRISRSLMLSIQSWIEHIFIAHLSCVRSRAGHLGHNADSIPTLPRQDHDQTVPLSPSPAAGLRPYSPTLGSSPLPSLLALDFPSSKDHAILTAEDTSQRSSPSQYYHLPILNSYVPLAGLSVHPWPSHCSSSRMP